MQDYLQYFDYIEFAAYHTRREIANYEDFLKIFGLYSLLKIYRFFSKENELKKMETKTKIWYY